MGVLSSYINGTFVQAVANNTATHEISSSILSILWKAVLIFGVILLIIGVVGCVATSFGFGASGIVYGSLAASIQTPLTVAGSCFALCQSCGAQGIFIWMTIGGFFGSILLYVQGVFSGTGDPNAAINITQTLYENVTKLD